MKKTQSYADLLEDLIDMDPFAEDDPSYDRDELIYRFIMKERESHESRARHLEAQLSEESGRNENWQFAFIYIFLPSIIISLMLLLFKD